MEPEKQEALKAPENQEDLLNKKVGTLEPEKLQAKKITVKDISIQNQTKKGSDNALTATNSPKASVSSGIAVRVNLSSRGSELPRDGTLKDCFHVFPTFFFVTFSRDTTH